MRVFSQIAYLSSKRAVCAQHPLFDHLTEHLAKRPETNEPRKAETRSRLGPFFSFFLHCTRNLSEFPRAVAAAITVSTMDAQVKDGNYELHEIGDRPRSLESDDAALSRLGKKPVLKVTPLFHSWIPVITRGLQRRFAFLSILGFSCTVLITWEGSLMYVISSIHDCVLPLILFKSFPRGSAKVRSNETRWSAHLTRAKWWPSGCHLRLLGRMAWDDFDIYRALGAGLDVRIEAQIRDREGTNQGAGRQLLVDNTIGYI